MSSKRDAIVDAAKELFSTEGFAATSPKTIQGRSGAGQGSFYHHFSSKADLGAAALSEIEAGMRERFDAIFTDRVPPIERLHAYLSAERNALRGCPIGRLAYDGGLADDVMRRIVAAHFAYVQGVLAATISASVEDGSLQADVDPNKVATTMVAVIQGGYVLSRLQQGVMPVRDAADGAATMLRSLETIER